MTVGYLMIDKMFCDMYQYFQENNKKSLFSVNLLVVNDDIWYKVHEIYIS